MNTSNGHIDIEEIIKKRALLINALRNSRSSVNEISLQTVHTISLTDLKNNIDFGIFPELEWIFSDENLKYLRPCYSEVYSLQDTNLGIVCRELVVAEIALVTGVDLTGVFTYGKYVDSVIKKFPDLKRFPLLKDLVDIRVIYANNYNKLVENKYSFSYPVYYNEEENTLSFYGNCNNADLSFRYDLLDLIDFCNRNFEQSFIRSGEVKNMDIFSSIKPLKELSIKKAAELVAQLLQEEYGDTSVTVSKIREEISDVSEETSDFELLHKFITGVNCVLDKNPYRMSKELCDLCQELGDMIFGNEYDYYM